MLIIAVASIMPAPFPALHLRCYRLNSLHCSCPLLSTTLCLQSGM